MHVEPQDTRQFAARFLCLNPEDIKIPNAQKSRFVGGYVLPEEETALLAMAHRERLNRSETLRWLIRRTAEQLGLWPPAIPTDEAERTHTRKNPAPSAAEIYCPERTTL